MFLEIDCKICQHQIINAIQQAAKPSKSLKSEISTRCNNIKIVEIINVIELFELTTQTGPRLDQRMEGKENIGERKIGGKEIMPYWAIINNMAMKANAMRLTRLRAKAIMSGRAAT